MDLIKKFSFFGQNGCNLNNYLNSIKKLEEDSCNYWEKINKEIDNIDHKSKNEIRSVFENLEEASSNNENEYIASRLVEYRNGKKITNLVDEKPGCKYQETIKFFEKKGIKVDTKFYPMYGNDAKGGGPDYNNKNDNFFCIYKWDNNEEKS